MSLTSQTKIICELIKKGSTIEAQEKIMELREEALELQEENMELKTEIMELKKELKMYTEGDRCPKCRESTWKVVNSKRIDPVQAGFREWSYECSSCSFNDVVRKGPKD